MNIFVLDNNPVIAAQMQCDRHVVKMVLESAQMLCTTVSLFGGEAQYRKAHVNHPCTIWARETLGNFIWLCDHGMALAKEYTHRYGKVHKSQAVIQHCMEQRPRWLDRRTTPQPLCMPEQYRGDTVVASYRAFYLGEKAHFAQWNKTREAPDWWEVAKNNQPTG